MDDIVRSNTMNNRNDVPFFIVGCPRSGTTLLQLLIDSHPNIAIPPESHIFDRFSGIFHSYGDLNIDTNLELLVKDLLRDYHIRDWALDVSVTEFCDRVEERTLQGVISLILGLYAQKEGKKRWGDKTPQHALYLNEINGLFPDAKFIHLVRDGRDVAVSSSRTIVGPTSIFGIAHEWKRYILAFNYFKTRIDKSRYCEVQYEKLVQYPLRETEMIFHFLNEKPIEIGSYIPESSAKKYYLRTDKHMLSLKSAITTKKIGVYENMLSRRDIQIFESIAKDPLRQYGYKINTSGRTDISQSEKIHFFLKDKIYRYYRKYFRPREINKAWILARRELQYYVRSLIRTRFSRIAKEDT